MAKVSKVTLSEIFEFTQLYVKQKFIIHSKQQICINKKCKLSFSLKQKRNISVYSTDYNWYWGLLFKWFVPSSSPPSKRYQTLFLYSTKTSANFKLNFNENNERRHSSGNSIYILYIANIEDDNPKYWIFIKKFNGYLYFYA